MTMGSRGAFPAEEAMTAFSALHLLRNYNQLLAPPGGNLVTSYHPYSLGSPTLPDIHQIHRESHQGIVSGFELSPVLGAFQPYSHFSLPASPRLSDSGSRNALAVASTLYSRRPRGEKKPIPDEQKDDRYYERRKRNNQAAKKSRDARKMREDQIALRATILEHENAVLRAQILTLREEAQSLRQLLLIQRKAPSRALSLISEEDFKSNAPSDVKSGETKLPLSLKDEKTNSES